MLTFKEECKLYKEARTIARQFKRNPGVTDIELGLKHTNGKLTNEYALRFKVNEKKTEKSLKTSEIIPKKLGKFRTDILSNFTTQYKARNENSNDIVRPLIGGIQIQSGIYNGSENFWGTMGCYFSIQNNVFGITNFHVLYGSTSLSPDIVRNTYVGKLGAYQSLCQTNTRIGTASNIFSPDLDYATFVIQAPCDQSQSINKLTGLLTSYVYPRINMQLIKVGANTGLTYGVVDGKSCLNCSELSIHIDTMYHPNPTDAVSAGGDSGSIWLVNDGTTELKPVALLYAGGESPQWAKAKSLASVFASIRNKTQNSII